MIRCTFAGHRDVCGVQAEDITEVLEERTQHEISDYISDIQKGHD